MTNLARDLSSLITLVSNVMEAYSACLFLQNKKHKNYQLTAYHSLSPHIIADASVEVGQGFMGWVLENNEPLSVNQFDRDTIVLGYYNRNEDIKSFMATPLPSSANSGALAIDSKKSWCFTSKDQKILEGFAQQFAYLADNALAAVQIEHRSMNVSAFGKYLASIRESESEDQLLNAICQTPHELLPFDACFLVLIDEQAGSPRLSKISGFGELFPGEIAISERASVAGYVLRKKEALRLPDLKSQKGTKPLFHHDEPRLAARSALCLPLISGGEILGCLGFTSKRRARFDAYSLRRGKIIATLAADAIAHRQNEARWRARLEIDPLTGERNAQHLLSCLHETIQDVEARGRQLALLSIAPDDAPLWKDMPEQELILPLFHALKQFVNGTDVLVRHEGPCFLLLLKDSSQEYAETIAERIIHIVRNTPFHIGGEEAEITISIGAACFPENAQKPKDLIKSSLEALAFAQRGGAANQLCFMEGNGR